jgi:hypothetical protein
MRMLRFGLPVALFASLVAFSANAQSDGNSQPPPDQSQPLTDQGTPVPAQQQIQPQELEQQQLDAQQDQQAPGG